MTDIAAGPEIQGLARRLGISRLADVTGLDIVGIPVVQTTRPASLSNIVSQGKGVFLGDAARSAVFEAAESFFAERLDRYSIVHASARSLALNGEPFRPYLLQDAGSNWEDNSIAWIPSFNRLSGKSGFVPLALVHTCFTVPPPDDGGLFLSTTTGLAASSTCEQAMAHGLLECIERDAIAEAQRLHGFYHRARIDTDTIDDGKIQSILDELARKGFRIGLWFAKSVTGFTTIWCHMMEDCDASQALLPLPAEGTAARGDPANAIFHAILEAAQSRVTAISGARDDFTEHHYPRYPDFARISAHLRLLKEGPKPVDYRTIASCPDDELSILNRLEAVGLSDVRVVTLDTSPVTDVAAVKVMVPGLLPLFEAR